MTPKLGGMVLLATVALLVAGCFQAPVTNLTPRKAFPGPSAQDPVFTGCGRCYEPTVTWVDDALFVATGSGKNFSVSRDGGLTFQPLKGPPLPESFSGFILADVILQTDPEGSLWWSDLLGGTAGVPVSDAMRVARSDDGGVTWSVNQRLSPTGPLSPRADRNWIAFGPDGKVLAACTCPAIASPMAAVSLDRGATFGAFFPVPAQGSPTSLGPPTWDSNGVVIPYLLGTGLSPDGQLQAQGVAAVHSLDAKTWTPTVVTTDRTFGRGFPGSWSSNDTTYVSWSSMEDGPRVAVTTDGGATWSNPIAVAHGETAYPNAWVAGNNNGQLAVAWYARNDTYLDYRVAVGSPTGPFRIVLSAPLHISVANTDFPHLAWSNDGRLAAVWSDNGVHVRVISIENPPGETL